MQGFQDYWIVDHIAQRVEIYRRNNAQLALVATLLVEDQITGVEARSLSGCVLGRVAQVARVES